MHWYGKQAVVNLLCFASLGLNINGAWAQTGTTSVYGEVADPQRRVVSGARDEHTEVRCRTDAGFSGSLQFRAIRRSACNL